MQFIAVSGATLQDLEALGGLTCCGDVTAVRLRRRSALQDLQGHLKEVAGAPRLGSPGLDSSMEGGCLRGVGRPAPPPGEQMLMRERER